MMKFIRLSCIFLALTLALCACGGTSDGKDTSAPDAKDTTDTTAPKETRYTPDLPDKTFGGEEFNVVGILTAGLDSTFKIDVEEGSGDVLENAIYKRNRYVEEMLDININYTIADHHDKTYTDLNKNIMSNDVVYDLYMLICRNAFKAAQEGLIYPVDDIPYLDLEAPWYMHNLNEQLSIDGKLFFAYSAECLNAYSQSTVVFFNKQMAEDYQIESLYDTVNEGKWTIDKMLEYARLVKSADDRGEETVFGISTEHDMLYPSLWVGADTRLIEKNEDDIPEYTLAKNEKLLGILELAVELKNEHNLVKNSLRDFTTKDRLNGDLMFSENKAFFRVAGLCHVSNLRDMKADFGIVPLPKYDEAQENYVGRMCDGWLNVVPSNSDCLEMTGMVMEALAAESLNTTIPAYFDVVLDSKVTRDDEAAQMLDIIFDNISVDLGDTVWMFAARDKITTVILNGNNQFASTAESIRGEIEKAIEDAIEALEALDE